MTAPEIYLEIRLFLRLHFDEIVNIEIELGHDLLEFIN